ncbi:transketolase [Longimicrobium terrae]|uniref:Transketolase n=1 Tax=Longimicrobium terrae TaxID=1639882 RepID=A0A841GYR5_9BACT|nr:transketolase [Longimicrobium terrae]MBB4636541.1 transketolase [Longimicrobium terrae]MBB6070935.1 transketolase [Longimicrobium terrae]NNC28957.1 transketolase [Longimicrobium terrae]
MATQNGELDQLCINTIRTLSMDAVQAANSGHPGTPMALAPLAYVIWTRHLRHNPRDPKWMDRDRFVLSCGHASMLLYSMLYLSGYDLTLDDLKNFRQWESKTPGHPEYGMTPGVETTTGPLGQGFATGVGMAMAEAHLAARYNRPDHEVIDHHVYAICSDGDLMEGVAAEAASFAGHLGLGKLIYFWDDNKITIEGSTDLAFTEDMGKRFEGYGWHHQRVEDGNDLEAIDAAIQAAKADPRPSLISVRTIIGFGSPGKAGSEKAHGEPLGAEEIIKTKQNLGWPTTDSFFVPDEALAHMRQAVDRGAEMQREWQGRFDAYRQAHGDTAAALDAAMNRTLPEGWDAEIPSWTKDDKAIATRAASGKALNAIAKNVPWLIGGSADLAGSTLTLIAGEESFEPGSYQGRNLHYGVREHAMGAAMNGMALHGGVRPYGATFLIFSDYMRPAVRLAALMEQPTIYIYTHDSVGLGEDGPTHQPIEQLPTLRAIPGLIDFRPGDANETAEAWRFAMEHKDGPIFMALTRQALPHLDRDTLGAAAGLRHGAYILADAEGGATPQVILIGSGSELSLALEGQKLLAAEGIQARVVSMPSWALFAQQDQEYRDRILPPEVRARVAVEAAHPMGWHRWVGEGEVIGISHFGASAPATRVFKELGFSAENVAAKAKKLLGIGDGDAGAAGDDAGPTAHGTDEKSA